MLEHGVHKAPVWRQVVEPLPAHEDFAGAGGLEAGNNAQQRGLAGTAFPEDGQELTLGHLQRYIPEYGIAAK